jgi:hypothetical protein
MLVALALSLACLAGPATAVAVSHPLTTSAAFAGSAPSRCGAAGSYDATSGLCLGCPAAGCYLPGCACWARACGAHGTARAVACVGDVGWELPPTSGQCTVATRDDGATTADAAAGAGVKPELRRTPALSDAALAAIGTTMRVLLYVNIAASAGMVWRSRVTAFD